jgi:hypothetical protein
MVTTKLKVSGFRIHKASGQAYCELSGRRFYLGKADSPEAKERYQQKISEWLASGRHLAMAFGNLEDLFLDLLADRTFAAEGMADGTDRDAGFPGKLHDSKSACVPSMILNCGFSF